MCFLSYNLFQTLASKAQPREPQALQQQSEPPGVHRELMNALTSERAEHSSQLPAICIKKHEDMEAGSSFVALRNARK